MTFVAPTTTTSSCFWNQKPMLGIWTLVQVLEWYMDQSFGFGQGLTKYVDESGLRFSRSTVGGDRVSAPKGPKYSKLEYPRLLH